MTSVFEYQDYRKYLNSWIKGQPSRGHGARSTLANAANCQLTYFSRVLSGQADFSLEQGEAMSRHLGHSEEEGDYFLLLLQHARAGTADLRNRFMRKITEFLNRRLILKDRFKVKMELSPEDQVTYYSNWYFVAVHILISIPKYQTKDAISRHLGFPIKSVNEVLGFLLAAGLAIEEQGRFKIGTTRIHLGSNSALTSKHHMNWRLKAMQSLERSQLGQSEDLHYSSIVSLSKDDIFKIRSILVSSMENFNSVVRDSKEEVMACLAVDFFEI